HPLERCDLVHVCVAVLEFFRMLASQRWECEVTQAPETVVEGDQFDALLRELDARKDRLRPTAEHEGTAMNPHHNRQLCRRRGAGRSPHIEEQAIFRRCPRDSRGVGWKSCLRTISAEPARIAFSLPRDHGLCRAPAILANRCTSVRNSLEA